jgi:hypothetical protein
MDSIDRLLDSLSKSKFRGSFHLNKKMIDYVNEKGIDKIEQDTIDIITKRLKVKLPNDGKQTPMKQVHPTFIAEHATGTCCRGCLNRIHHIDENKVLDNGEINYIKEVIIRWIKRQL